MFKVPLIEASEHEAQNAKKSLYSYLSKFTPDQVRKLAKRFQIVLKAGVFYIYANFLDEWHLADRLIVFPASWILKNSGAITLKDDFIFQGVLGEIFKIPPGIVVKIYDFDSNEIIYAAPKTKGEVR